MIMYKLTVYLGEIVGVLKLDNNTHIPFDPSNTDYARFKKEINEETAKLQDAEGATMSAAEAKAYVATLP